MPANEYLLDKKKNLIVRPYGVLSLIPDFDWSVFFRSRTRVHNKLKQHKIYRDEN